MHFLISVDQIDKYKGLTSMAILVLMLGFADRRPTIFLSS